MSRAMSTQKLTRRTNSVSSVTPRVIQWQNEYEAPDPKESEAYKTGKAEVKRFIQAIAITTYGALGRRYKDEKWISLLDMILRELDVEGILTFHEDAIPMKISAGGEVKDAQPERVDNGALFRGTKEKSLLPYGAMAENALGSGF